MKQITIYGNLGANAVLRTASDGRQLMTYSIAVNHGDSTLWFNCVSNYREKLFPYLLKGQAVCAVGDLQVNLYNGKIDLSVSVDKCELCGRAPEQSSQPVTSQNDRVEDDDSPI